MWRLSWDLRLRVVVAAHVLWAPSSIRRTAQLNSTCRLFRAQLSFARSFARSLARSLARKFVRPSKAKRSGAHTQSQAGDWPCAQLTRARLPLDLQRLQIARLAAAAPLERSTRTHKLESASLPAHLRATRLGMAPAEPNRREESGGGGGQRK